MRYNLGPKFNKSNWKKLFSAVEKGDWDTAAKESKRIGVHTDRNTKTYERFKNLSTKDEAKN